MNLMGRGVPQCPQRVGVARRATVDADVKKWPSSFDRLDHLDVHVYPVFRM